MSMESWLQKQEREEQIKRKEQAKRAVMDHWWEFNNFQQKANHDQPEPIKNKINDAVNRPDHYQGDGIECIDAIRAALGTDGFIAYCRGNAIKYAWRAGKKGPNAAEDMGKAAVYSKWAAEAAQ